MTLPIVYLNGEFLPREKAQISAFDRGFLFGDGVYEVIPVYSGKPLGLSEHLKRLNNSLKAIHFISEIDLVYLEKSLCELLQKNNATSGDYSIYVQITRGTTFERSFYFSSDIKPTVFVFVKSIKAVTYEELRLGKTAITVQDIRWKYCHVKSISLLASVLLYDQVRNMGCDEGIIIRDGFALEGISSNVFVVSKGKIFTPELSQDNLSGVTRELILRLLRENNFFVFEEKISVDKLLVADEIWITSSTRGIFPIVKLNGTIVGSGSPGDFWEQAIRLYFSYRKSFEAGDIC